MEYMLKRRVKVSVINISYENDRMRELVTELLELAGNENRAISHATNVSGETNKIYVKLYEFKGKKVLSVSNPGEEIPISERQKLFERFYRTDSSHEFFGHFGLGLAIAKSIADANNARITVDCKEGEVIFSVFLYDDKLLKKVDIEVKNTFIISTGFSIISVVGVSPNNN